MTYEIGDYVLIKRPKGRVGDELIRFRDRFIGETALITQIYFDGECNPSHYRIDIDTDDLHVDTYIGPWWTPEWLELYESKIDFSFDESQLSSLL